MGSAAVGRGFALAIALLLLCIAGGDAGHALAGLEGRLLVVCVPATHALSGECVSGQPHDATSCLLCQAARLLSTSLHASKDGVPAVTEECNTLSTPEVLAPSWEQPGPEAARAPPARLSA